MKIGDEEIDSKYAGMVEEIIKIYTDAGYRFMQTVDRWYFNTDIKSRSKKVKLMFDEGSPAEIYIPKGKITVAGHMIGDEEAAMKELNKRFKTKIIMSKKRGKNALGVDYSGPLISLGPK